MAMGRRRDRSRDGWPANVYPCKDGFKYRHPVTKKDKWMGTDKARVFAAARKLNAILIKPDDLMSGVLGTDKTMADAVATFRKDDLPHRGWAPSTALEHKRRLDKIETDLGTKPIDQLGVREVADYLRTVTTSVRNRQQYRLLMVWIFACALEDGWIDSNPAAATRKGKAERKRSRLTLDAFTKIREHAAPWLQVAMDLSLHTLLRREDIVSLTRADVRENAIWVIPGKTEGSTGIRLKIAISPQIQEVLDRSSDGVLSPYIVHRLPEKARPREMRAKNREHHTQVLPEQLTRAFAEARDDSKLFEEDENPPTFHEIRSLGGALYRDAGWKLTQVQALMGHASESMTKLYVEGHDAPWTEVSAGLQLAAIGRE